MLDLFKKLPSWNAGGLLRGLIFFVLFYLYIWLVIEPCLIYHGGGMLTNFPIFYTGWAFFHETIWFPGGFVKYLSAFLSQFLYINWAGAIVLTIHAWLIYVCMSYFLKAVKAARFHFVSFIPAILLLATYNGYTYHFTTTMAFLAALAFLCLYVKAASKNKLFNVILFLVLSTLLYIIADGAFLLFAIVCGIYEIFFRRQLQIGFLCLLSAVVLPYLVGVMVFNVSIINAYSELFWEDISYSSSTGEMVEVVYALYLLLPVITIVLGLWRYFAAKAASSDSPKASKHKWAIDFELPAIFLIAAATIFLSRNYERKIVFEVDYYVCQRNWQKVLLASQGRRPSHLAVHMINRALYHTSRLPYDMFSYPQDVATLLFADKQDRYQYWHRAYTFYDLGALGICEHRLVEALEIYGGRPEILKHLAMVKMANGELGAARVYLGALEKTLFYSSWAKNYLQQLESDAGLSADEEIQHLRSIMPEEDADSGSLSMEKIFTDLLEKNKQNRMAFEYMMAWYMLSIQLDKFVQNISRLDDFDYPQIPRHYEEALLIYMSATKTTVNLNGRSISDESQRRFKGFLEVFFRYRANKQAAFAELAKHYGDSYFFYYFYGTSGVKSE